MQTWHTAMLALTMALSSAVPAAAQVSPQVIIPAQVIPPMPADARTTIDAKCWTDWSEAALIVRRETLVPIERVSKLASAKHPGAEIIKVTLCEEQGKFVYRVLLRERQGQLRSELLDAR
jgi:hypothetical protein